MNPGIMIVGLGPGEPQHLTRRAWEWLSACEEIWLRTSHHPTVAALPPQAKLYSFDEVYELGHQFEQVYSTIVERILELGRREQGVTYAVPGHPFVAEATAPEIWRRARREGLPVQVIDGLSFLEPTFTALGLDPYSNLVLVDALELSALQTPSFAPSQPALIAQIYSRQVAANVKSTLGVVYPDDHPVRLVHAAGTSQELVEELKLYEIDRSRAIGLLTSLYLPSLGQDDSFENFQEIIARLRAPDGCPWDREQTHQSLRQYLLEETYEALAALDDGNTQSLREELGDLLLQIVLHAQIGLEEGEFTMGEIIRDISQKLVRRHPHVFGEVQVEGVKGVLQNWEKLKAAERQQNGDSKKKGMLDGVPREYPSLAQAQQVQDRAARVGFDWNHIEDAWKSLHIEVHAFENAQEDAQIQRFVGRLLFAAAGLARWHKVDAESALRETVLRYRRSVSALEIQAQEQGRPVNDLKPGNIESLWK